MTTQAKAREEFYVEKDFELVRYILHALFGRDILQQIQSIYKP